MSTEPGCIPVRGAGRGAWLLALSALSLALFELHEIAHTWVGRILCGAWGTRDFNVWSLIEGCESWVPTAAGPVLTYTVIWVGALLLRSGSLARRRYGLALVFAASPFGRFVTVALGGGDELQVAYALTGGVVPTGVLWVGCVLLVLFVIVPPLITCWRALAGDPQRAGWFLLLLLGPFIMAVAVLLIGMNTLLGSGFLAHPVLLGEPLLVLLTTVTVFALAAVTFKHLNAPAVHS